MIRAVDMFCGAGGASTGLVRACDALGVELELLAINHWPTAVQTHLLNHPKVRHKCEAIEHINPREEVPGGRLNLLLAGPECTHHSNAAGGRPKNEQSRASAWHIAKWAQELYIDTILIENVPEFRNWGPLGADMKPLKSRKGETFKAFIKVLESLGYRVEYRILNAADYGDPTTRQRLFILARRGKHALNWPTPTHSKHGNPSLFGATKKWKAAREIIDWSIEGKSIFNRKKPLRPATIARIIAGLEKFGGPELRPFLVILRNNADGKSVDQPVPTIAAEGNHLGLAQPFVIPVNHGAEELRSRSTDEPLPTLTAKANQYLVEPMVLGQQSNAVARPVSEPVPTVAGAGKIGVIEAALLGQHGGATLRPVGEPAPTIATDGAIALINPVIVPYNGTEKEARAHSIDDPLRTQTTENRFGIAQPVLVAMEHGGRELSAENPLPTITTARGGAIGVAEACIVQTHERRDERTSSVDEPLKTITAIGGRFFGLVEPFIVTPGGANLRQPRSVEEPAPTVTGSDRLGVAEPFLHTYYGNAGAVPVTQPVPTITAKDRVALVQPVINGLALDIRFRMLQPHELSAAMSFPKEYQFSGKREDIVRQIGNAWPGELSFALCKTIAADYRPKRRARREKVA